MLVPFHSIHRSYGSQPCNVTRSHSNNGQRWLDDSWRTIQAGVILSKPDRRQPRGQRDTSGCAVVCRHGSCRVWFRWFWGFDPRKGVTIWSVLFAVKPSSFSRPSCIDGRDPFSPLAWHRRNCGWPVDMGDDPRPLAYFLHQEHGGLLPDYRGRCLQERLIIVGHFTECFEKR